MLMSLALAVAARAEPVTVRAAPHDGFGRIVFNWPTPVPYTAESEGSRVVIRFGRPIETDLGAVIRVLGTYVRAGDVGADGRSVVLATVGNLSVRAFDLGSAVVLDLMEADAQPPAKAAGAPAAPPAASSPAPAARPAPAGPRGGEALGVRVGEHEGYSRVVFDWPRSVGYTVDQAGGAATITFDQPANPDLGSLKARPPRFIEGVDSSLDGGRLKVVLHTPVASQVRHFRSGPKVVVDIMAPAKGTPPPVAASSPEAVQPTVKGGSAGVPPAGAPPMALTAVKAPGSALSPPPVAGRPTPLVPVAPVSLAAPAEAPMPEAIQPISIGKLTPPQAGLATSLAEGPARAAPTVAPAGAVTLRFDWTEPVAAAVFSRAEILWVVFDRPQKLDVAALRVVGGNVIRGMEQVTVEQGTVLRIETVAGVNPSVRRDGLAWLLDFVKQPLQPQTPIEALAQTTPSAGTRVFLPVPEPGLALAIDDPEVGDTMVVVPVIPLGYGMGVPYEYPELRLLPTIQGVVVQPAIDNLRVRALRQGIELTSGNGLQVTPVSREMAATNSLAVGGPISTIFDFERWRNLAPTAFEPQKNRLLKAAAAAKELEKEKARLELATFFLARGLAAEALGVLDVMAASRPGIAEDPRFRAMRGAGSYLMDRLAAAEEDWYHPSLNNNDEATFWRALLAARKGDAVQASRVLRQLGSVVRGYPDPLKMPLSVTVAQTAVEVGDTRQASHFIDLLAVEAPNPRQRAQMAYVQGRVAELSGDFDGALAKWEEAELGIHLPSRAKATVARTELMLKLDKATRAEAIGTYEKLRYVWRGDDFEFGLLRRLGHLHLEAGDYRNGLRTLRQAATYFRDHRESPLVTQEMTDSFAKLYLDGDADALPPVSAIALYDEFKELTPAGAKGDEMIRKLADRLVSVDLLERGAELLESQIEFRLQGPEKARVGSRLAVIRLMANEPERALAALDATESPGLPADLATARRYLRARADVLVGQTDKALALLDKDEAIEAERIRADIFWAKQDWANAAQVLGRQVKAAGITFKQPLDGKQGLAVLKLTIALALSGNERGLSRTRTDFGPLMAESPYADAFRLIASPSETGLIDYQTVAGKVKEAENFQSFMTDYRDRLKTNKLSELFASTTTPPAS
jgi:tetratricopeptide (TPR) repeat protein